MTKMTPAAFIAALAPQAIRARRDGSPMFPSVRLAQNILETGCKLHPWNNLGGIKVGSGKPNEWWRGKVVNKGTWEVYDGRRVDIVAAFRAYDSVYDFYRDQDRLFSTARYTRVRKAKTPEEQAQALQACGYATDPAYAEKLIGLIRKHGLKKYDGVEVDEQMTDLEKKQFAQLQGLVKDLAETLSMQREMIQKLADRLGMVEENRIMDKPPAWAEDSVREAVKAGLIDTPAGGSYDFYRMLAVLHRAGILKK